MNPYYADDWLTVYLGDCREIMAAMEPESVHCVVTSPPYWGLRDYGTASWTGGDAECDHKGAGTNRGERSELPNPPAGWAERAEGRPHGSTCGKCGATRVDSQLGLEPTPELFVEAMVAVFREVRRVLRKDGTVWLNLGDSYSNPPPSGTAGQWNNRNGGGGYTREAVEGQKLVGGTMAASGLPAKNLVGIPWRVAFALQADGWYLRSDIIWAKPNPMPESVTDRPTKAHEYVFLLSKSPRYYYDADAVREPHLFPDQSRTFPNLMRREATQPGNTLQARPEHEPANHPAGRNLRSVWNIATEPYPGAHFATFPRALVEPCIKAGTSEKGVCPECGAPWVREVEETAEYTLWKEREGRAAYRALDDVDTGERSSRTNSQTLPPKNVTTGWRASCQHYAAELPRPGDPVPATVLDPFAGSGTTGLVAQSLSRRAVLIDLSADYLTQLMDRNRDIPLGLMG